MLRDARELLASNPWLLETEANSIGKWRKRYPVDFLHWSWRIGKEKSNFSVLDKTWEDRREWKGDMHRRRYFWERRIMWWVWERRRDRCTEASTIPLLLWCVHNTTKGLRDLKGGASYAMLPCLENAEPRRQQKTLSPRWLCVFVGHKKAILSSQRVRLAYANTLVWKKSEWFH